MRFDSLLLGRNHISDFFGSINDKYDQNYLLNFKDATQQQFQLPQDYWLEILHKSFLVRWEELSWINIESHIIRLNPNFL